MMSKRRSKRAQREAFGKLLVEPLLAESRQQAKRQRTKARRAEARRVATGVARSVGFRYRAQLWPLALLAGLWLAGMLAQASGNPAGVAVLALLAGVPVVLFHLRGALQRRAEQVYALACCTAGTLWVTLAAAGLAGTRPVAVGGVLAWFAASVLWWRHHTVRDAPESAQGPTDLEQWWQQTNLFPGSRLANIATIDNGTTAELVLPGGRGNTTTAVIRAAEDIASAREKSLTTTLVEHTRDRAANRAQLTFLDTSQVDSVHPWPGPSLDPNTGLAVVGPYADQGVAYARFWRPESGPKHMLVSGASDAGKSRFLDWNLLESAHSGLIASWVGDPQGGQSLPAWRDAAHRFADTPEDILDMLRDLEREMDARSRHLARLEWADDDGRTWVGKEDFDPTPQLPIIEVLVDEAQDILEPGSQAVRIVTRLVRKGRKCGVRVVLVTHLPSIDQIGGVMTMRAQLVAGNVACLRTADNVTKNMVLPPSFPVNPYDIPGETTDGESTAGSMYLYGPGARPVLLRNYMIGKSKIHAAAADAPKIPLTLLSGQSVRMPGRPWPHEDAPGNSSPLRGLADMIAAGVIAPNPDDPEGTAALLAARDQDIADQQAASGFSTDASSPDTSAPYPLDDPEPAAGGNVRDAILGLDWEQRPERTRAQIVAALAEVGTPYSTSAVQKVLHGGEMCRDGGEMVRVGHGLYRPAVGLERGTAA